MFRWRLGAAVLGSLLGMSAGLPAAPPLTTIQDVLYKADGTRFEGTAVVEWKSFQAADLSNIAPNSITVRIINGILRVQLVPTTNASSGAYYTVRYNADGKTQFTELWAVPPSSVAVKLKDVRTTAGPGTTPTVGALVQISDVVGLSEELAIRPSKGVGYQASRASVINANGELEAAAGNLSDCIRVDGTSGPCSGPNPGFVDLETPAGIVDGSNGAFSIAIPPSPAASLLLYRNGILQKQGLDYSLSGNAVSFFAAAVPQPGDVLLASYRQVDIGSPRLFGQVLCSSQGIATSASSMTRLGRCTIPTNLLQPGDRVDVRFNYSHEGASSGFSFEVRWGSTSLVSRSAGASETIATGRAESVIYSGGTQWSLQNWGATLVMGTGAGTASDDIANPINIDFLGQMAGATTETVTLRNFTVIRYPPRAGS